MRNIEKVIYYGALLKLIILFWKSVDSELNTKRFSIVCSF